MRYLSFILLIIIGLMTLSPVTTTYSLAGHSTESIEPLDVCHGPAAGINMVLPDFIHERTGSQHPLQIVGIRNIPDMLFTPLLISHLDERPPRN